MGRIVRTRQSLDDVLDIWRYIAVEKGNVSAADALVDRFEKLLTLLAEHPQIGISQDRYRLGMRSFGSGNYVLFYEPVPSGVRLLRVLHGARRFDGMFD